MSGLPWRATADGLSLVVRLTPKGGRDAIDGLETMSDGKAVLKARVRAVPEDGKANAALVELLAKALRVPRSAVSVATGQTSRVKMLEISGDPDALAEALARAADRG
ncbi:MAG: DUF167 domain-containing protein [Methylobacteriaceae bacterium]|nr:DUF167 domain-containing protein [Methylobacteriaceae bacterium]HPG03906.1 DUF167 family protein [Rhodoblastus sp.]